MLYKLSDRVERKEEETMNKQYLFINIEKNISFRWEEYQGNILYRANDSSKHVIMFSYN